MPIAPAAVELLRELAPLLDRWGSWYLFDAQAVLAYGVPRLSADVDVTVHVAPSEVQRFADEVARAGFDSLVSDSDFVRRTHVLPFVHRATGMPVDLVLAGSGLEQEFADRAKDVEDARALWRAHGEELDLDRIESLLRLLEEALGKSDLLPTLRSIRR